MNNTFLPQTDMVRWIDITDFPNEIWKDAVDGVVHHFANDELAAVHYNDPKGTPMSIYVSSKGLSAGEKVKIIIAKTEQQ